MKFSDRYLASYMQMRDLAEEKKAKDLEVEEAKKKFDAEKDKKKKGELKKTVDALTKDSEQIKAKITEIEESIKEN